MRISVHPRANGTIDVMDRNGNKMTFNLAELREASPAINATFTGGSPKLEGAARHYFETEGRQLAQQPLRKVSSHPFGNQPAHP